MPWLPTSSLTALRHLSPLGDATRRVTWRLTRLTRRALSRLQRLRSAIDDDIDFFPQAFTPVEEHDSALEFSLMRPEDGIDEWVDNTKELIEGMWIEFFKLLGDRDEDEVAEIRDCFLREAAQIVATAQKEHRTQTEDDGLHYTMLMALNKFVLIFTRRLMRQNDELRDELREQQSENWRLQLESARLEDEKAHLSGVVTHLEKRTSSSYISKRLQPLSPQPTPMPSSPNLAWPEFAPTTDRYGSTEESGGELIEMTVTAS